MRILSLDLSKYKTVACDYEAETGRHQFATVLTTLNSRTGAIRLRLAA